MECLLFFELLFKFHCAIRFNIALALCGFNEVDQAYKDLALLPNRLPRLVHLYRQRSNLKNIFSRDISQ